MSTTIIEKIKQEIANIDLSSSAEEVGTVISVGDGIVEIGGLQQAEMMEMVRFETADQAALKDAMKEEGELLGLVLNLEEESVKAVILGSRQAECRRRD